MRAQRAHITRKEKTSCILLKAMPSFYTPCIREHMIVCHTLTYCKKKEHCIIKFNMNSIHGLNQHNA